MTFHNHFLLLYEEGWPDLIIPFSREGKWFIQNPLSVKREKNPFHNFQSYHDHILWLPYGNMWAYLGEQKDPICELWKSGHSLIPSDQKKSL